MSYLVQVKMRGETRCCEFDNEPDAIDEAKAMSERCEDVEGVFIYREIGFVETKFTRLGDAA